MGAFSGPRLGARYPVFSVGSAQVPGIRLQVLDPWKPGPGAWYLNEWHPYRIPIPAGFGELGYGAPLGWV